MNVVSIGVPSAMLRIRCGPDAGSPPGEASVDLELGPLLASTQIEDPYDSGFADLADFFSGLARDWRGWEGVRSWEAVAGYLRLDARHDGHVQLEVTMSEFYPGRWKLTAELTLEPGEQVHLIAEDLRDLGRPTPP